MKTILLGQNCCIEAKLTYNKRLLIEVFLLLVVEGIIRTELFFLFLFLFKCCIVHKIFCANNQKLFT